jgi:uncharacterized protein YceK
MRWIEIALIINLIGFSGCATLKTNESGNSNNIISKEITNRKQQYSNDKEAIRAEISYTKSLIKKIHRFNEYLQKKGNKKVSRATAKQGLTKLTREIKISQQLNQYYQQRSNIVELTIWKAKIAQLEQEKYELESHILEQK